MDQLSRVDQLGRLDQLGGVDKLCRVDEQRRLDQFVGQSNGRHPVSDSVTKERNEPCV